MSRASDAQPRDLANPFAASRVRPGAIEFLFPDGTTADGLVARLAAAGWRGQIVGAHGSGKSTLLATLAEALERAGRRVVLYTLHDGQRWLPRTPELAAAGSDTVVLVDGCEQLSRAAWAMLRWRARRRGWGLLVTTHRPLGLPTLYHTAPTAELAARVVQRLLGDSPIAISPDEVAAQFARRQGDVRETLFGLYDLYESYRRRKPHG